MFSKGILPLQYLIHSCTTSEKEFPINNIKRQDHSSNPGWSSVRLCSYPQTIIIQFFSLSNIKQINLLINHERIPSQINLYSFSPKKLNDINLSPKSAQFDFIGKIIPTNHSSSNRELKKIQFISNPQINNCLYLKFELLKNYVNSTNNKFNQVGLVNLEFMGYCSETMKELIGSNNQRDKERLYLKVYKDEDFDDLIASKLYYAKKRYYTHKEDVNVYEDIEEMRRFGRIIKELQEKSLECNMTGRLVEVKAIESEIEEIKRVINYKYRIYGREVVIYDNENYNKNRFKYPLYKFEEDYENLIESNELNDQEIVVENKKNGLINEGYDFKELIFDNNYYGGTNNRSKEILERHKMKKMLIKQSINEASQNIKIENLTYLNPNINL